MHVLAAVKTRLFLVCFVVYSAFFATNVVREHYPAFALAEHGNFRCDEYQGFHSDIFVFEDGHSYINNNVLTSVFAAVPLLMFDSLLDALEAHSKETLKRAGGVVDTTYDTKYPNRREMFRKVKLAGKDLRFGAATVLTSVLLMAPVSAFCVVLLYAYLLRRGIEAGRSSWLALLFAFGTPLFYRTATLCQNTLVMAAAFGAFLLLFEPPGVDYAPSLARRRWAGVLLGITLALDYSGVLPAGVLGLYFLSSRARAAGVAQATKESLGLIACSLPGVLFLLLSQYWQFGSLLTPAQFVMEEANYTDEGVRGMGMPSLEIFLKNLFSPSFGMYTFGPILLLGLVPIGTRADKALVLPRRERRMLVVLIGSFMLFCAANRYSLMQFNTGFRYLVLLVPFIFLQACDRLAHTKSRTLAIVTALCVLHSLVLCMTREGNDTEKHLRDRAAAAGVPEYRLPGYFQELLTQTAIPVSYQRVFTEGPQLPWLTVLAQTSGSPALKGPALPSILILFTAGVCLAIWRLGTPRDGDDPA